MKTSKKLASLLLAALLVFCMFTMTACGDTSWSAKYDGNTVPGGVYPLAVLLAYQGIYSTYGPVELSDTVELEDGTSITIATYLNDTAKDTLANYVATDAMFEELGLSISDDEVNTYLKNYGSYYSAQRDIYKANGISEETFNELIIMHTLRLNALTEHFAAQYIDSASDLYMSDGDIQKYFDENYLRFNYMIYYAVDADGNYLTTESEEYKAQLKYLTDITNQQLSFDKYLKAAESYNDTVNYREGGTMDAVNKDAAFADATMGDIYYEISNLEIGASGVYTFAMYDSYYNTCNAIISAQRVAPELTGIDYIDSADEILATVCSENLYAELAAYYEEMNVTENKNVFKTFSASNIDFGDFVSIDPAA